MDNIRISAFADEASSSIDEQIVALKRNRLFGLEIRNVDGTNVSDITLQKANEVRKKLDDAGLEIWSVGSPIGKIDIINDSFETHVDKFKHTLEVAQILGAGNIRMFSFYLPAGCNRDDYKNEVIDRLGELCDISSGYGVDLCHENEKGIYGDIASRCLEIHRTLPKLKAVFDPANFVQCGQDTIKAWDLLGEYVKYVHIKDCLKDGSIVPAGLGDGNISYIAKKYIANGGRNFTMEPHLTVFSGLEALENEGNTSVIGGKYTFANSNEAFDSACTAFKKVLSEIE